MSALWLAALVLASAVDQLGFASDGAPLCGASLAAPRGASAAALNPAAAGPDVHVAVGYVAAEMWLRLNGAPHAVDMARHTQLALLLPFSLEGFGRLGLSFAMTVPDHRLLRARVLASDRPRFLMYDNRLQRVGVDGALSYRYAGDSWSAGLAIGLSLLSGASGQGATFHLIENGDYHRADAAVSARLPLVATPVGALQVSIGDWHLGALVRGPLEFEITVGTQAAISLAALRGEVYTAVAASDFFTPLKVSLGAAWTHPWVGAYAALDFHRWSELPTGVITLASFDFEGLPVTVPLAPSGNDAELRDVWSPRLGVELTPPALLDVVQLAVRVGAFYEPTPVVDSDILLDGDRFGGGLGFGIASVGGVGVFPEPISLDLHARAEGLVPRLVSPSPGSVRGALHLSGWVLSGGATLTLRF